MPLLGETDISNLSLNKNEAEVIVKEYFNYITDIGLSFDFSNVRDYNETENGDIVDIMENISERFQSFTTV